MSMRFTMLPDARRVAGTAVAVMLATGALLGGTGSLGVSAARAAGDVGITRTNASERIKLGLNKSIIINLPADAYDILVANPTVADAVTRTSRRIYLFGKAVGETNIFVFGANGEQIASLDLAIERDVAGLDAYIKRFLPHRDGRDAAGRQAGGGACEFVRVRR
jgi:pilus assembly protein CpaC